MVNKMANAVQASCGLKAVKTSFYSGYKLGKSNLLYKSKNILYSCLDSPGESESQDTTDTKTSQATTEATEPTEMQETQATENVEGQDDILECFEGKMGEEEYENFRDQVRKSTFALRRIIAYADKINEWTFETGSVSDRKFLYMFIV